MFVSTTSEYTDNSSGVRARIGQSFVRKKTVFFLTGQSVMAWRGNGNICSLYIGVIQYIVLHVRGLHVRKQDTAPKLVILTNLFLSVICARLFCCKAYWNFRHWEDLAYRFIGRLFYGPPPYIYSSSWNVKAHKLVPHPPVKLKGAISWPVVTSQSLWKFPVSSKGIRCCTV